MPTWEMRDDNLPIGSGPGQSCLQPPLLRLVRRPEPALTILDG